MNTLTVSGEAAELKRFVLACQGLPAQYPPIRFADGTCISEPQADTDPYFCFNALIPTPQSVIDIGFDGHEKYPSKDMLLALLTGSDAILDGYHWNIRHWGTKWDVYYDRITPEEMGWSEGCDSVAFEFDTAWSPPREWLQAAAELFPSLYFKLHYEEPGAYFAGDLIWEDGKLNDVVYDAAQCEEAFAWLMEDEEDEEEENAGIAVLAAETGGDQHDHQQTGC